MKHRLPAPVPARVRQLPWVACLVSLSLCFSLCLFSLCLLGPFSLNLRAAEGSSGLLHLGVTNSVGTVTWPRPNLPGLATNQLRMGPAPALLSGVPPEWISTTTSGYRLSVTNSLTNQFFALTVAQMSSNALLTANLLNRLAYGPTPDELARVTALGPQAYLDEQLEPEGNTAPLPDAYRSESTNGVSLPPGNGWNTVTVTGNVSASTFYIYLTGPGDAYIDDVRLSLIYTNVTYSTNVTTTNTIITTNLSTFLGTNVLVNGDFELPFNTGWTNVGSYYTASALVSSPTFSGARSLHLISTAPIGSDPGGGNAVTQFAVNGLLTAVNTNRCVLSFAYFIRPNSGHARLNVRLSGGGVTASDAEPAPAPQWAYVTATGTANATPTLYLYLDGAGEVFVDDLKLVSGVVPEAGSNLVRNGTFETALGPDWQVTANFTNSGISTVRSHTGSGSLHAIASAAGTGNGNALFMTPVAGLTNGGTYTASFWCTTPTRGRRLTVRLSGSGLQALAPDSSPGTIKRRFDTMGAASPDDATVTSTTVGGGALADLRAWFIMNAVSSPRLRSL